MLTTLNEGHRTNKLHSLDFDTVVITRAEEIPTAQIFLAAGRASKRVVLGGDFLYFTYETPVHESGGDTVQTSLTYQQIKKLAASPQDHVQVIMDSPPRLPQPMADLSFDLAYQPAGLVFSGLRATSGPYTGPSLNALPNPMAMADTSELGGWCGKALTSLSPFNLASALASVETARAALRNQPDETDRPPQVLLVSPFDAQVRLLTALIEDLELTGRVAAGMPSTLKPADMVIYDTVLDQPITIDRFADPESAADARRELAQAVVLARHRLVLIGSSAWLEKRSKPGSALEALTAHIRKQGTTLPLDQVMPLEDRLINGSGQIDGLFQAIDSASKSIFGFLPFLDPDQWPVFESTLQAALKRGVAVTLLDGIGSRDDQQADQGLVSLREAGAVLIPTMGYQGGN